MTAVWAIDLPDSQKIVLLALADCANDEGLCWPSMATLSKKCSKGERTVQGVIKDLVSNGHLSRTEVPGKGCKYIVHPRSGCAPAEAAPAQPTAATPAAAADKPSRTTISGLSYDKPIRAKARKPNPFPMLDCTEPDTWADFLTNRNKKRLPNTASAHRKLETDLAAMAVRTGWPPGEVFAACVAKGWGAIYDPRDEDDGRRSKTIRTTHPTTNGQRDGFSRALDQAIHNERTDGLACPPRQSDDASIARLLSFTPAARASG